MVKLLAVIFCAIFLWADVHLDYERVVPEPEIVVDVECYICYTAIKSNTNWSSRYFTEETTSYFCSEDCMAIFNDCLHDPEN